MTPSEQQYFAQLDDIEYAIENVNRKMAAVEAGKMTWEQAFGCPEESDDTTTPVAGMTRLEAAKRAMAALDDMPEASPDDEVMALDEQRVRLEADHRTATVFCRRMLDEARACLAQAWAIGSICERQGRDMNDDERKRHADLVTDARSRIEWIRNRLGE